jgi:damage-control phosphatase, subfamily I
MEEGTKGEGFLRLSDRFQGGIQNLRPYTDCGPCVLKWIYERLDAPLSESERFTVLKRVMAVLSKDLEPSANLGALCNRCLETVEEFFPATAAGYQAFKAKCNQAALELLDQAREFIAGGETPRVRFERACAIASVGNVAPIGAPSAPFEFSHVEAIIKGKSPLPLLVGDVFEAVSMARHVFYVADNAGEIGFDSLLISLLKELGLRVTLIVKQDPFFDDASPKDASFFHLDRVADAVLSVKAVFEPGHTPPEVADAFARSDLVISKGTGNCEALWGFPTNKKKIIMLKVKCGPMAEEMDAPIGTFVVRLEDCAAPAE